MRKLFGVIGKSLKHNVFDTDWQDFENVLLARHDEANSKKSERHQLQANELLARFYSDFLSAETRPLLRPLLTTLQNKELFCNQSEVNTFMRILGSLPPVTDEQPINYKIELFNALLLRTDLLNALTTSDVEFHQLITLAATTELKARLLITKRPVSAGLLPLYQDYLTSSAQIDGATESFINMVLTSQEATLTEIHIFTFVWLKLGGVNNEKLDNKATFLVKAFPACIELVFKNNFSPKQFINC